MTETQQSTLDNEAKPRWQVLCERLISAHRDMGHRDRFNIPKERIMDEFEAYVKFCSSHKTVFSEATMRKISSKNGNSAEQSKKEMHTPMTVTSFEVWLGVHTGWISDRVRFYEDKGELITRNEQEYLDLLLSIKSFFNSQLLEGALANMYNPILACCLLGLKARKEEIEDNRKAITPVINILPETKSREELTGSLEVKTPEVIEKPAEPEARPEDLPGLSIGSL